MAYEIETKDGIVIRGIPDNIKPDDPSIKAKVTNARQAQRAQNGASGGELMQAGLDPTEGNSFGRNALIGVGKAISDTGHGLNQLGADAAEFVRPTRQNLSGLITGQQPESRAQRLRRETDQTRAQDEPLMNTGGGVIGNVAGNIGMALAPGAVLKGVGVGADAVGATNLAEALKVAGGAAMVPKSILGAAAQGGAMGAVQPVGEDDSRTNNVIGGAIINAAIPTISTVYKTAKSIAEPLYESGRGQILARALREASGGDDNLGANLRAAKPLVPGSMPTVAEASNNPGIAALQRSAFATTPEVTNDVAQRMAQQNTARVSELLDLAGTGGEREFHNAARTTAAQKLYQEAYDKGIDIARHPETGQFLPKNVVSGVKGEITQLLKRPAIQDAVDSARTLAANEGVNMKNMAGSIKGLDYVKRALDDKIGSTQGNEQRILVDLKNRLLTTLDRLSPKYAEARTTFQEMSKPINAMDTAAEIAKKSVNGINDRLTPAAFARALRDETAQSATGFNKATLANTLEPQQLERLNAIRQDLQRADFSQNAGRGSGSDTVQKLAYNNILGQAGVPNFLRSFAPGQIMGNLAGRGADLVYGNANKQLQGELARALLNPQEAATILENATPSTRAALAAALARNTAQPLALSGAATLNARQ